MNLDMQNVCRTCLRPDNLVDLFSDKVVDGEKEASETVRGHVKICYDIEIRANDKNSRKICRECIKLLSLFSSSRTYAKAADHHMTSINSSRCYTLYSSNVEKSVAAVKSPPPTISPAQRLSLPETPSDSQSPVPVQEITPTALKRKNEPEEKKVIGTTIDKSNILKPTTKREKKPKIVSPAAKLKERQKKLKKILVKTQKQLKLKNAAKSVFGPQVESNHTNGVKIPKKRGRKKKVIVELSSPVLQEEASQVKSVKGPKKPKLTAAELSNYSPETSSLTRSATPLSVDTALHTSETESLNEESEKRASSGRILKPVERMEL